MLVLFMKLNIYVVESVHVVWLSFSTPETKKEKKKKNPEVSHPNYPNHWGLEIANANLSEVMT